MIHPSRRQMLAGAAGAMALAAGARRGLATSNGWGDSPIGVEVAQLQQGGWLRGRLRDPARRAPLRLNGAELLLDAEGRYFTGFDRDAAPQSDLTAGPDVLHLTIAPRAWQMEHVDAPFHPEGVPDAEFARRRTDELAQIKAARARTSDIAGWRQDFAWPLKGRIAGLFGAQRVFRGTAGAYHGGIDIAGPVGATITAPADGVVILAADAAFTLEGHLLMLDHGMGLNSAMLHCSRLLVAVGATVRRGQPIAEVGMTGRATGPHLHWGLRWREARLDPLLLAGPMG